MRQTLLKISVLLPALISLSKNTFAQFTFEMPGASATYITGLNNSFHICGYAEYADGTVKGFVKTKTDTIPVIFTEYPNANVWVGGINDLGQVVARYNNDPGSGGATFFVFTFHYPTGISDHIEQTNGYQNISPNDINNEGWISGDLRNGNQRRVFTYHESQGLSTNFVMIGNEIMQTYGGHHVDATGKTSAYWIQGTQQRSAYYHDDSGFSDTLTLNDPVYPTLKKTNLKGGNSTNIIVYHAQSRTTYIHPIGSMGSWGQLMIPGATEVWGMDLNETDHIAGYYRAEDGIIKGFYQADEEADFAADEDGFNLNNDEEDMWSWEVQTVNDYNYDPYWYWYHDQEQIPFPGPDNGYITYPMDSWINWKDWVRAYGEAQCYHHAPNVSFTEISQPAFHSWRLFRKDGFDGAGFGFCVNALFVRNNVQAYYQRYPETADLFFLPENTSSVQWGVTKTYCASSMRAAQAQSRSEAAVWNKMQDTAPLLDELSKIYGSLVGADNASSVMNVSIENADGEWEYKTVIPTKLERSNTNYNGYYLYYYDPNHRFDTFRYFTILFDEDTVNIYTMENPLTSSNVKIRMEDYEALMGTDYPQMFNLSGGENYREGSIRLSFLNEPDLSITSTDGSLVVSNQLYSNTIPGAHSLESHGGYIEKPHVFKFDPGEYTAAVTAQEDEHFSAWSTSDQGTVMFTRTNAEAGEIDHVFSSGTLFSYLNQSGAAQDINAMIVTSEGDMQFTYSVDNIGVSAGQDISLQIVSPTQIMITSSNAATTYDVKIRIFSPEVGFWEATASGIPIGTDVTQLIIPSLTEDTMDGIIIETDANQDGTYESSDAYDNEGIPNMLLSHYEVSVPNSGANETVHVSNVGGGNLNWTVVSSPSWITVNTGATGINHGPVEFTVAENTATEGRQDYIIIEAASPANDQDTVLVIQGQGGGVGIDKINLSDVVIYMTPNPAKDMVQFSLEDNFAGKATYTIYNSAGQLVNESIMRGQKEILNTSKMDRGVYQVKFIINGKTIVKKLVLS